jgi:hypothetical protein
MLRFRKKIVRRGKFLKQTSRRLKRKQSFLDSRRGSKRNMGFFSEERINPNL